MIPTVLLHSGHVVSWSAWVIDPEVISGTFIACSFYLYFTLRQPGGFNWLRAASFYTGVAVIFLALVSPLDVAADRLLSLHMLQHVILATIGPPLVLLGLPPGMTDPLFSFRFTGTLLRNITNPVLTAPLFIVNMWIWHVPQLYEAALNNLQVHAMMHTAFLATGLLFWWPVIQPSPSISRVSDSARLLYLFVSGFPMALLALFFIASNKVIYSFYAQAVPLWGISTIADQQVAGLVMGVFGEAAGFIAITILFRRFLDREELAADAAQAANRAVTTAPDLSS